MRRILAETKLVRTGDLVRISLRLPKSENLGRITIWSRQDEDDFSPYIDEKLIEASTSSGKPIMLKPMEFRLTERRRHVSSEFYSETTQQFRIVQEIDSNSDPKVQARIRRYGKASTAFRRNCRNAFRTIRDFATASIWSGR